MKWNYFKLEIWNKQELISCQIIQGRIQEIIVKKVENILGHLLERKVLFISQEYIPIENALQYRLKVENNSFEIIIRNDYSTGVIPHYTYEGIHLENPPVIPSFNPKDNPSNEKKRKSMSNTPYSSNLIHEFQTAHETFHQVHSFLETLLQIKIHCGPFLEIQSLQESPYFLEFFQGELSYQWNDTTLAKETYQLKTFGDQAYGLSKTVYMLLLTDIAQELSRKLNFSILEIQWKKITPLQIDRQPIAQYLLLFQIAQSITLTTAINRKIESIQFFIQNKK